MAQKNLAVLTGGRIKEGFFYKKVYGRFARRPKKMAVITRLPYGGVSLYYDGKINTHCIGFKRVMGSSLVQA